MGLKIKEHNSSAAWQRTTDLVRIVNRLVKKERHEFHLKDRILALPQPPPADTPQEQAVGAA